MILSCNSCEKKFVVPDNAISAAGRLVQCSSCGNKWKQFPILETKTTEAKRTVVKQKVNKIVKIAKTTKKKKSKKKKGPDLYSPEYLSKKHGIKIQSETVVNEKSVKKDSKLNFGFYNYLIVITIFIITFLKLLQFFQNKIIFFIPALEIYLDYLFETLRNIKDILINFFLY